MLAPPVAPLPPAQRGGFTPTERLAWARGLDQEIDELSRRSNAVTAKLARKVFELGAGKGYVELGYSTLAAYTEARLCWRSSKTRDLRKLVERLEDMPLLRAAFEAGDLFWSKAVLAARATSRAPQEEAEWLESARRLSGDQLKQKSNTAWTQVRTRSSWTPTPSPAS